MEKKRERGRVLNWGSSFNPVSEAKFVIQGDGTPDKTLF